jgi:membrane-bound lytic murein transglycosylase B
MLERAFVGVHYNARIIQLDRNQPEFRKTWQQYRATAVSQARITRGRELFIKNRELLAAVSNQYGVTAGVIMGIWGMESDFGRFPGTTYVIEALTTLAFDGRRGAYFRAELMDALRILDHGDITPEQMTGSFAGAMGPTQFMPSSFWRFAVDFSGTGKRDIWNDLGDILASTANNLAKEGWRAEYPWGVRVLLPPGFDTVATGRDVKKPFGEWIRAGLRTLDGRVPGPPDALGAVILPGGPGDEAFLVYWPNFLAIRRYNPADFYCCAVGLIGDQVTA